ncbi:orotate phosphoribosyltransferase [Cystobasidium minutum MCA 4210]|uniref:orotate phosphoribosyltransferase n=1 Tax=Cystobasidium minutum MCA 4210 TaxID=1397322 RepID=UPI0034CE96C0|eukprot:jgi/Rhomi1/184409/fgenesh1_pm.7_\
MAQIPPSPSMATPFPVTSVSSQRELKPYAASLLSLALSSQALLFGSFTLKSGRTSPYFFNAGKLNTGSLLYALGSAFAAAIVESKIQFDVLFGPAYKGIPLAAIVAMELSRAYNIEVGYAFNRKEAKGHGEGGSLVGAELKGKKVLIIDDVITAGTAIREAVEIIKVAGGQLVGIAESLDRQEKGKESEESAVQQVEKEVGVPVIVVATMLDIIEFLRIRGGFEKELEQMQEYRKVYGVV